MDRGQSLRLWFDDEAERSGKGLLMVRHRAGLESVKSGSSEPVAECVSFSSTQCLTAERGARDSFRLPSQT